MMPATRAIHRASAFLDLVDGRRSVRHFANRPIDARVVDRVLHAASRAPSAGNEQAYEIALVTGRARLETLAAAADDQSFVANAAAALVFCAVPRRSGAVYGERGASLFALQDATIACAYAQLAATSLGVGSVWIGSFDPSAVSAAIDASAEAIPIAILPLGHPAEDGEPSSRRAMEEIVRNVS